MQASSFFVFSGFSQIHFYLSIGIFYFDFYTFFNFKSLRSNASEASILLFIIYNYIYIFSPNFLTTLENVCKNACGSSRQYFSLLEALLRALALQAKVRPLSKKLINCFTWSANVN